jgi:Heavy metal binding domain
MKYSGFAGMLLALTLVALSACQNNHNQSGETAAIPGASYICPMDCEKGKTYDKPGTCPVCNMKLEVAKAMAPTTYFTDFSANPTQLEAGKSALLTFNPKIKGNESAAVPLDLVHEKKMHLVLVADDLSWFDHIHPEYSASGNYEIKALAKNETFVNGRGHNETRFENGGKFWAFADFKPTGGRNQVDKIELNIAGTPAKPVAYTSEKRTTTVDGYALSIIKTDNFTTGTQHFSVKIEQGGKMIDPATFENYLGEKAHVILIETASKAYLHTHPSVENGQLSVHTSFEQPGIYRGWLQFQTAGKVHTADFVLKVEAAH